MSVDDAQKLVISKMKPDLQFNPLEEIMDEPSNRSDTQIQRRSQLSMSSVVDSIKESIIESVKQKKIDSNKVP